MRCIKHIPLEKAIEIEDELAYLPEQVASKTIAQNEALSLKLFAFDQEEEIISQASRADALIMLLDGKARITIDQKVHMLGAGQSILVPAGRSFSFYALDHFKMMMVAVFPPEKKRLQGGRKRGSSAVIRHRG